MPSPSTSTATDLLDTSSTQGPPHVSVSKAVQDTRAVVIAALKQTKKYNTHDLATVRFDMRKMLDLLDKAEEVAGEQVRKVKQDMMLQDLVHQKKMEKLKNENAILLVRCENREAAHRGVVEQLHAQATSYRGALVGAEAEANSLLLEADHLQRVVQMHHEDLAELRRIETEAANRRSTTAAGLPPAYGSLDEEDVQPPWRAYEDRGSLHVANLKRSVREVFDRSYREAFQGTSRLRSQVRGSVRSDPDLELLADSNMAVSMSQTLSTVSSCLEEALNHAKDINVIHQQSTTKDNGVTTDTQTKALKMKDVFIADRIAKLVLDLCWRAVAALEIRPSRPKLTPAQRTRVKLAYTQLDNTLYLALTASFNTPPAQPTQTDALQSIQTAEQGYRDDRVLSLQIYQTQIRSLADRFAGPYADLLLDQHPFRRIFLAKSQDWLSDMIDKERELSGRLQYTAENAAAAVPAPTIALAHPTAPAPARIIGPPGIPVPRQTRSRAPVPSTTTPTIVFDASDDEDPSMADMAAEAARINPATARRSPIRPQGRVQRTTAPEDRANDRPNLAAEFVRQARASIAARRAATTRPAQ